MHHPRCRVCGGMDDWVGEVRREMGGLLDPGAGVRNLHFSYSFFELFLSFLCFYLFTPAQ